MQLRASTRRGVLDVFEYLRLSEVFLRNAIREFFGVKRVARSMRLPLTAGGWRLHTLHLGIYRRIDQTDGRALQIETGCTNGVTAAACKSNTSTK